MKHYVLLAITLFYCATLNSQTYLETSIPIYGIESLLPYHLCQYEPDVECFFGPYCLNDIFEFQAYQSAYENDETGTSEFVEVFFNITYPSGAETTFSGLYPDIFEFELLEVGNYEIQLDVDDGEEQTFVFDIIVTTEPEPDFSMTPNPVYAGGSVNFSVDALADFCFWDVGALDFNFTNNFTDYFLLPTEYEVDLVVNYEGCGAEATQLLQVLPNDPVIVSDLEFCVGDCHQFIGTCPDESVVYNWNWQSPWMLDGSQNPEVCFDEAGTYTITLTTFAENMGSWESPPFQSTEIGSTSIEIVVVEAALDLDVSYENLLNCSDENEYSVNSPNALYEYEWIVEGGELTLVDEYTAVVDWDEYTVNQGEATLTVTAYGANVCPAQVTLDIESCCIATDGLELVDGDTDEDLAPLVDSQGTVLFGSIFIDGTVYFNNNLVFEECDIMMGPGAAIVVGNNSQLSIMKSSHVYSCDGSGMWKEIKVLSGSSIRIENSRIEDGITAINCEPWTEHIIFNSQLMNNFVSFHKTGVVNPGSRFTNNTVEVDRNLYSPYESKDEGHIGVLLTKVPLITIGHNSYGNHHNDFINLDFGVFAEQSSVLVCDNSFTDITNEAGSLSQQCLLSGNLVPPGRAIYSSGGGGGNYQLFTGWQTPDVDNEFQNCFVGVEAYGDQDLTVVNGEFIGCSNGVRFEKISNKNINVSSNQFTEIYNTAIYGIYADCVDLSIQNNDMFATFLFGISLNEINDACFSYNPARVNNNCIYLTGRGISISESSRLDVFDNSINQIVAIGIEVDGGNKHRIYENYVEVGEDMSSDIEMKTCIRISDCLYTKVTCNEFLNANTGAHYLMNSKGYFLKNKFSSMNRGLILSNDAVMGTQGNANNASDNFWEDVNEAEIKTSPDVNGLLTTFYVYGDGGYVPDSDGAIPVIITNAVDHSLMNCEYPGSCQEELDVNTPQEEGLINEIISLENMILDQEFPGSIEGSFISIQSLYERVSKDSLILENSEVLSEFKTQEETSCSGKLVKVKDCLHAKTQDELLVAHNLLNNELETENMADQTSKDLYQLLIDFLLEEKSLINLSEWQREYVESIAWMCPSVEGNAVYRARSVMNFINEEPVYYFNLCEYPQLNGSHKSVGYDDVLVEIYPNPSNGKFSVNSEQSISEIKAFDQLGREVEIVKIMDKKESQYEINSPISGIYNIVVTLSDKSNVTKRLIIQ